MRYEHKFNLKRRLLYLFTGKIHIEEAPKSDLDQQMDFLMKVRLLVTESHYKRNWYLLRSIKQENYSYYLYFLKRFGDMPKACNLLEIVDKLETERAINGWEVFEALPTLRELIREVDAPNPTQNSVEPEPDACRHLSIRILNDDFFICNFCEQIGPVG